MANKNYTEPEQNLPRNDFGPEPSKNQNTSSMQQNMQDYKEKTRENLEYYGQRAKEVASESFDKLQGKLKNLEQKMEYRIRNNPLQTLMIVAGVGLLAMALSRRLSLS